jgi:hypothetical protein
VPVILWAGCISWFSTGAFSAHSTHHYIDPVLRFLFGDLSPQGFRLAHSVVRKTAHFTEYAFLGVLLCRALTAPGARITGGVLARTITLCGAYASIDEIHQTFETSRTGSALDVLIDVIGATTGSLAVTWSRSRRAARRAHGAEIVNARRSPASP